MNNVLRRVFGAVEDLMAYLLLAIGALMSVAGVYSIITGSHIVQVEEGWTSVIAGATLFTGGIVTIALGLVLRTLVQLTKVLRATPVTTLMSAEVPTPVLAPTGAPISAAAALPPVLEPAPMSAPAPEAPTPPLPSPMPSPSPPPSRQPLKLEPTIETWRHEKQPAPKPPAPAKPATPLMPAAATLASVAPLLPVISADAVPAPDRATMPHITSAPLLPVHEAIPPEPELEPDTRHQSDDYRLETPSTPEHDLATEPSSSDLAPRPPAPPMDDWLDRAFAEFDHDLPKAEPTNPPPSGDTLVRQELGWQETLPKTAERPAMPDSEPELEPTYAEPDPLMQEPVADVPPVPPSDPVMTPAPAPSGPSAAVIGRYEADGTSYVMYADGSIDAQSESGVYRFASMAELKAFIET